MQLNDLSHWSLYSHLFYLSHIYPQFCHKAGMFYYTLGNIRPELRSSHRAIQLIACVTSPNLDKYGFEAVLDPFINDVNTLSEVGKMII